MNIQDFYEKHHNDLVKLAYMRVNNQNDAEDAVQEVFLEAIQKDGTKIFNDFDHMKNHYEKAVITRIINRAVKRKTKTGGPSSLHRDFVDKNSGGFNAILDKTDNERMCGDYGDDGPPSYDDYSEDSFP